MESNIIIELVLSFSFSFGLVFAYCYWLSGGFK